MSEHEFEWERLETWLFDHDTERFTVYDIAEGMDIPVPEASSLIQLYLSAQRALSSSTLYVLKREGRTKAAVWSVGVRTADSRIIGQTLFDDVMVRVKRAYQPDMLRLAAKNPRAARYAEAKIEAVTNGAMRVLAASLDAIFPEDEEDEE